MRTWRRLVAVGVGLLAMAGCGQRATEGLTRGFPVETNDRGVVATRMEDGRVYVGWRLLASDKPNVGFNVYRRGTDGAMMQVNDKPITESTNVVDRTAPSTGWLRYIVEAIGSGKTSTTMAGNEPGANYVSIMLDGYQPQKVALADLDGDGRLDYVVQQPKGGTDPFERYWNKSETTYKLDGYNADGKLMWRYDMGWAIEKGHFFAPFVVYDVDGDGKAEVYCKAGEGDPRGPDGRVTTGPEYIVKLDGMTGKVVAKGPWPDRSGWEKETNTPTRNSTYNFSSRNQMAIAYVDGKHPSVVIVRGTYSLIKVRTYDGQLNTVWDWSSDMEANPKGGNTTGYRGQGAHCIRIGDVDGDGCDEIVYGAACVDHNGKGLWTLDMGHPDALHMTDFDPSNPGMEAVYGFETKQETNGLCVVAARTGKILHGWDKPTKHVEGSGMFGYVTDRFPGPQFASFEAHMPGVPLQLYAISCMTGEVLDPEGLCGDSGTPIYWDADDYKEIISGDPNPNPTDHHRQIVGELVIHKYKGQAMEPVRGNILTIADVLGDWREEMVVSYGNEIRIYTTNIPATTRRPWLMTDHRYNMDVACFSAPELTVTPAPKGPPQGTPAVKAEAATQPAKMEAVKAPEKAAVQPAKAATK